MYRHAVPLQLTLHVNGTSILKKETARESSLGRGTAKRDRRRDTGSFQAWLVRGKKTGEGGLVGLEARA